MTTVPAPQPLPQWLVNAVMGLVASAYEAGRNDRPAPAAPVAEQDVVLYRPEAAKLLRCGTAKLDILVRTGEIPSFLLGGRRMFRRAELVDYMTRRSA